MRGRVNAYGFAVAALAAAVLVRWLLDPILHEFLPLVTLFGAVAAAVWLGGYRPAVLVVAAGYVACAYLFMPPRGSFGWNEGRNLVGLIAYLVTCFIIIGLGEAMRVSQRRFEELVRQQQISPPTPASIESIRRKHGLGDVAVIGFGLTLAVLVVGGVLGYVNIRQLVKNEEEVAHTHLVIEELQGLLSTLKDAETGQRGYLLAGREKYLQPYEAALQRVVAYIGRVKELTSDNHDQQARLAVLEQKIGMKLDELKRTVALMKGGDRLAALEIVRTDEGKGLMDDVRDAIAVMQHVEHALLQERAADSAASSRTTLLSILVATLIGVVVVGAVFSLTQRNLLLRQRAAEAVAEQRERLRVTLASIGDAVMTTDVEGRIAYLNAVAESLTGWTQAEAAGQPLDAVFRIVNEKTREAAGNPAERALREGAIVGLANHTILIRKDGTERPIDDSASPIRDGQGNVIGCVLVFRDITERRRAEQERADDAARIESVVNHVIDGIIAIDENGTVEAFNPAAEKMFGYQAAEVIGQNVKLLMPEPFHGEHDGYLANYRRTGQAKIIGIGREVAGRRQDGSTFPMELAVSEFWLSRRRYYTGIVRNITDRKKAEDALQRSERGFRQLADAMPQIVWTAQPDGFVDYYNERWYEYTRFPRGEFGQPSWERILHPDDVQRCRDSYFGCIKAETPYQIEYRFKDRSTGGYRWFLGRAVPVRDEQGRTVRWFGTCTDIDDTKRTEELLKAADRRKDEFLATLAHELRNPLAPLRNALELLRRADDNAPLIEQARTMMGRQVGQMVRLVDDLLDISRITRGKLQLRQERVVLADVLDAAIETARPLIEASAHELTVTMPPQPIVVLADPTRLAQVFSNLLNNATKYTERAGHIWLSAQRQDNQVVVSVRDTGIGIAAKDLPEIFGMFSQVAPALERSQGGLGIGLALVRGLVELHGGTVEARSGGPGKGSDFAVHLPIVDVPVAAREPSGDSEEVRSSRKCRILVVDDLRDAADSLAMMLQMMGHDIRTAYDGLEAVQTAAAFQPNVVLLDIGLPKMNGYEAARHLREQPWGGNVALVALTGWGQEEDKRRSLEAGFDHHLTKPVDPAALEKLLALINPVPQH